MPISAFLTDPSVCIGCKACEVACKEWNQIPDDGFILGALLSRYAWIAAGRISSHDSKILFDIQRRETAAK